MERREGYPNLDLKQSGNLLRYQIRKSGYSVQDIQNYLVLSCPQPVYRWFQGKTLPSVDHLCLKPPAGRAHGRTSGRTSGKSALPGSFWREAVSVFLSETVKPGVVNGCAVSIGLFVQ